MAMMEFRDIKAMIIDPRGYKRDLLRGILASLRVHDIVNLSDTLQALSILQTQYRDVVFCGDTVGNSADFVKKLRRDVHTRNITVPVFLVSAGSHADQALVARDAGINGVIVKPVSVATVEHKLQATLQTPRGFVASRTSSVRIDAPVGKSDAGRTINLGSRTDVPALPMHGYLQCRQR